MQPGRRELDEALRALEGIGREVTKQLISPPWWPTPDMLEPARQFAYRVARVIGESEALNDWIAAWQEGNEPQHALAFLAVASLAGRHGSAAGACGSADQK